MAFRRPSPILLAALALAAGALLTAALLLRRPATTPVTRDETETVEPTAPAMAAAPGARPAPPHLIAPPRLDRTVWSSAGETALDERDQEQSLLSNARGQAAQQLGLSEPERDQVRQVHEHSDALLAALIGETATEKQPAPVATMRKLAEGEVEALTAVLGRDRAVALRRAERAAYGSSMAGEAADAPIRNIGRLRLAFMRWTPSRLEAPEAGSVSPQ